MDTRHLHGFSYRAMHVSGAGGDERHGCRFPDGRVLSGADSNDLLPEPVPARLRETSIFG